MLPDQTAEIIQFPGRDRPKPFKYGPFSQPGTLDGTLVRIGGKDDPVPVGLLADDGNTVFRCNATRDLAKQIAVYLFGAPLRVSGDGRWCRDEDGTWCLDRFNIGDFTVLEDTPLTEVIARMRAAEGNGWTNFEDPIAELMEIRRGKGEVH